ncbi:CLUMA_CG000418, isoform A [Clunio marinus]|uniref:CLUMA_CG000418, isoform A n=1 Tax=Clunio marinus TaxID=568069 RepID=A0A1J1HEG1_9DIPT|nr:CLUMA_CG000418, isoform A [Clunio marinus]
MFAETYWIIRSKSRKSRAKDDFLTDAFTLQDINDKIWFAKFIVKRKAFRNETFLLALGDGP